MANKSLKRTTSPATLEGIDQAYLKQIEGISWFTSSDYELSNSEMNDKVVTQIKTQFCNAFGKLTKSFALTDSSQDSITTRIRLQSTNFGVDITGSFELVKQPDCKNTEPKGRVFHKFSSQIVL